MSKTDGSTPKGKKPGGMDGPVVLGVVLLLLLTLIVGKITWHGAVHAGAKAAQSVKDQVRNAAVGPSAAPPVTLGGLKIHAPGSLSGYSRLRFGQAWADVDHNGCDTRNDTLHRDLALITTRVGTHDCVVLTGILHDRYTGTTIHFEKAHATLVQIDHVVPLGQAWVSGARPWTTAQRTAFANDPANLLAVDGHSNEAKGDKTPDEWMPPRAGEACDYARRYTAVKEKYRLTVTRPEESALSKALATC